MGGGRNGHLGDKRGFLAVCTGNRNCAGSEIARGPASSAVGIYAEVVSCLHGGYNCSLTVNHVADVHVGGNWPKYSGLGEKLAVVAVVLVEKSPRALITASG